MVVHASSQGRGESGMAYEKKEGRRKVYPISHREELPIEGGGKESTGVVMERNCLFWEHSHRQRELTSEGKKTLGGPTCTGKGRHQGGDVSPRESPLVHERKAVSKSHRGQRDRPRVAFAYLEKA